MKKLIAAIVLLSMMGCTTRTEFGECIGLGETPNPTLHYKLSAWNVALGIVFIETIFVPIVVAVDDTYCPVGPAR